MGHFPLTGGYRGCARVLLLAVAGLALAGCAAGAADRGDDPAAEKSEKLKKLPADMQTAGDEAARRGEFDRAASFYTQAIELEPTADLWFRLGWIYARLDKKPLAAQSFAKALQLDDDHAGAHEEIGLWYLEGKRREQAKTHLSRAVELDSKRWRSHNALGVLADANQDYPTAIHHYQAALAVNPDSPLLLNNLGYSYYLAGDLAEAEQFYRRALTLQPGYRPATANTGLLHARRGEYEKALEIITQVMEKAQAHNDVGFVALQNGDLDAAEWLLNEAIRLSPTYYRTAQQNLARLHEARAQLATDATTPAAQAVAAAPSTPAATPSAAQVPATPVAPAVRATSPPAPATPAVPAKAPAAPVAKSGASKASSRPGTQPEVSADADGREYRQVRSGTADLRLGREPNAPVLGSLRGGARVKVLRMEDDWALVSYAAGGAEPVTVGWVRRQDLTRATPARPAS